MISGICKYCGCTPLRACPGGCRWVDQAETVCTTCSRLMTKEELMAAAQQNAATFTELVGAVMIPLPIEQLMLLASLVQLARRHPHLQTNKPPAFEFGTAFIAQLVEALEAFPALQEMIQRGGDPKNDLTLEMPAEQPESQPSKIIIP